MPQSFIGGGPPVPLKGKRVVHGSSASSYHNVIGGAYSMEDASRGNIGSQGGMSMMQYGG